MRLGLEERVLCGKCGELYVAAKVKVESGRGFGTFAI